MKKYALLLLISSFSLSAMDWKERPNVYVMCKDTATDLKKKLNDKFALDFEMLKEVIKNDEAKKSSAEYLKLTLLSFGENVRKDGSKQDAGSKGVLYGGGTVGCVAFCPLVVSVPTTIANGYLIKRLYDKIDEVREEVLKELAEQGKDKQKEVIEENENEVKEDYAEMFKKRTSRTTLYKRSNKKEK